MIKLTLTQKFIWRYEKKVNGMLVVHNQTLLILDEPTAGVDVELRKIYGITLESLNKLGVTIILTTHYLKEAEILCDQIAVAINKVWHAIPKNLLKLIITERTHY